MWKIIILLKIVEVTGEPCTGKTTFIYRLIKGEKIRLFSRQWQAAELGVTKIPGLMRVIAYELLMLLEGVKTAGLEHSYRFFIAAMALDIPIKWRLNIFRNIIHKYAIYFLAERTKYDGILVVDEGISHIPFLFSGGLKQLDPTLLFCFPYHRPWIIKLTQDLDTIIYRMKKRGHKRIDEQLQDIESFVSENRRCSELQDIFLTRHEKTIIIAALKEHDIESLKEMIVDNVSEQSISVGEA